MFPAQKIICPTDFSDVSLEAMAQATSLAQHFGSELILVNVIPALPSLPNDPNWVFKIPEYERILHADAEERLKKIAGDVSAKGIPTRIIVGHGDAAEEIVRIAHEEAADLIVIATHGTSGWRRVAFGSVAEKVVRLATVPVLSFRIQAAEAAA